MKDPTMEAYATLQHLMTAYSTTQNLKFRLKETKLIQNDWDAHEVLDIFEATAKGLRESACQILKKYFDNKIPLGHWEEPVVTIMGNVHTISLFPALLLTAPNLDESKISYAKTVTKRLKSKKKT